MKTDLSQLRQSYLEAEYALDAVEVQRTELQAKIKQTISSGKTEDLPQLRAELVSLETVELPLAQTNTHEAAIKLHEAEALEHQREVEAAHAHLDEVFNRRNARMTEISNEYRALQLDESRVISQAHKVFLDAQHAVAKCKAQAEERKAQLARLQAKQQ